MHPAEEIADAYQQAWGKSLVSHFESADHPPVMHYAKDKKGVWVKKQVNYAPLDIDLYPACRTMSVEDRRKFMEDIE